MLSIRGVPVDASVVSFGNLSKFEPESSPDSDNIQYIQGLTIRWDDNNKNQGVINNLDCKGDNAILDLAENKQEETINGDAFQSELFMQSEKINKLENIKEYYFVSEGNESSSKYCDIIFEGDIQSNEDIQFVNEMKTMIFDVAEKENDVSFMDELNKIASEIRDLKIEEREMVI